MDRRQPDNRVAVFLLSILIAVFGWIGKNIYDQTQIIDKRLTVVESTLIDRTEAVQRLAVLEHRVSEIEKTRQK